MNKCVSGESLGMIEPKTHAGCMAHDATENMEERVMAHIGTLILRMRRLFLAAHHRVIVVDAMLHVIALYGLRAEVRDRRRRYHRRVHAGSLAVRRRKYRSILRMSTVC